MKGSRLARMAGSLAGTVSGLLLGFQAAAAEQAPKPSAPRAEYARAAIANLCAAPGRPLIVDAFYEPYKIVGGAPLERASAEYGSHGDLVGAVLAGDYDAYNIPQKMPLYILAHAFADIAKRLRDGTLKKPSYINLSSGVFLDIADQNARFPFLGLTPGNIGERREELLRAMIAAEGYQSEYRLLLESFQALEKMGIPVVTAAGNDFSPMKFNIVSLLPGTITVGAWHAGTNAPAPLSNGNSLIDVYRNGDVLGRKAGSGMDVNGDGIRDFAHYAGARSVIRAYSGTEPGKILKTLPADIQRHKKFPALLREQLSRTPPEEGLYGAQDLYELLYGSPLNENHLRDIRLYGEYMHYPSFTQFHTDAEGKIIYSPAARDKNIIADFRGTSFAVRRVCEADPAPR